MSLTWLVRKSGQYFGPGRWHVICNSGFGNSQFKFMRQGADNGDKLMIPLYVGVEENEIINFYRSSEGAWYLLFYFLEDLLRSLPLKITIFNKMWIGNQISSFPRHVDCCSSEKINIEYILLLDTELAGQHFIVEHNISRGLMGGGGTGTTMNLGNKWRRTNERHVLMSTTKLGYVFNKGKASPLTKTHIHICTFKQSGAPQFPRNVRRYNNITFGKNFMDREMYSISRRLLFFSGLVSSIRYFRRIRDSELTNHFVTRVTCSGICVRIRNNTS